MDKVLAAQRFAFAEHGAGAGVDSAWEQEKLEARKLLEKAAESPASSACFVGWFWVAPDSPTGARPHRQLD